MIGEIRAVNVETIIKLVDVTIDFGSVVVTADAVLAVCDCEKETPGSKSARD